ncbi:MAG: DinB family protein [Anaerolineales bacterium]|nr:DinB family protein [Anaerolineales bacterium]
MKELLEYRVKLVVRLGEAAQEFRAACEAVNDPFAKVEGEWTLHQIASHTRDVEKLVYGARIQQTLTENNPEFKNFDADAWMTAHYNQQESLADILDEFVKNVNDLCKTLRGLPQEAWSRESRHETQGGELPLQLWVERSMAHIVEHLQSVKRA